MQKCKCCEKTNESVEYREEIKRDLCKACYVIFKERTIASTTKLSELYKAAETEEIKNKIKRETDLASGNLLYMNKRIYEMKGEAVIAYLEQVKIQVESALKIAYKNS